jgi:Tfp pilus assembly protein PilF
VSRRRPAFGWVLFLFLLSACATTPPTGVVNTKEMKVLQARAAYDRGVKHMDAREVAAAYIAFREAVQLDDETAHYHDALGVAFLQMQRADIALGEFQRAAALDPAFANALFHIGLTLTELRRWPEALESLKKAVAMPTLSVPQLAWQTLGVAALNMGQLTDAEAALRFAINLDPDMSSAYYNLGLVLVAANRKDDARGAFRRARELAPESAFGQAAAERLKALENGG